MGPARRRGVDLLTTARAVPFYCPYCGDEDLRPLGDTYGAWWCQSCRRAWSLKLMGTGTPEEFASEPESQ